MRAFARRGAGTRGAMSSGMHLTPRILFPTVIAASLGVACADDTTSSWSLDGRTQADEIIVIEEQLPDCDSLGAGWEPVAKDGGWICSCTIDFFCGGDGWSIDPDWSGPSVGPGPSGAGSGAGGVGGSGAGGAPPNQCPEGGDSCLQSCEDDYDVNLFACATLFVGIPPESPLCAPDSQGECTGAFGLCAQGLQPDGNGLMDPFCWPWPTDLDEAAACTLDHSKCADLWYDTYRNSEECQTFAADEAKPCRADCYDRCDYFTASVDQPVIKGFSP